MTFWLVLAVAVAGSAGAVARFVSDALIRSVVPPGLPWATLAINITGSFLLGMVTGLVLRGAAADGLVLREAAPGWSVVAAIGFCGSYTTFSTASVEAVVLLREGRRLAAVAFGCGTVVATAAAVALGIAVTGTR